MMKMADDLGKQKSCCFPQRKGGSRLRLACCIMIQYHTSAIPLPPETAAAAIRLLTDVFGEAEAALEWPQFNGSEARFNQDQVFWAQDEKAMVGMLHMTTPRTGRISAGCPGFVYLIVIVEAVSAGN